MSLLDDTVEMVRSNKGGAKIIHRGYMYTVHKKKVGGIRWRCARRILHCKGSITTGASGPPVINLPHNHVPDLHAVAMARCRSFSDTEGPENFMDSSFPPVNLSSFPEITDGPGIKDEQDDKFVTSNSTSPSPSSMKSILKSSRLPSGGKPSAGKTKPVASVDADAEVCLRWNSHHSNMQSSFPSLLDKEMYVDVTLAAEGKTVKCHRLILSSCSDFFEDMLKTVPPFNHPIIFLHSIEFWQIKALIDFMYKGEVNVDQSKLESLLKAAEILQVKGLAGKSNIKKEEPEETAPETPIMEEDSNDDYLGSNSPPYIANPTDEDEFKPYYYYKKKLKKNKKKNVPAPGQLKTVPCNLRGTKSRPNIKQPVFYDPDFPDHDPNRSISPPTPEKDSMFHIDNVKIEPIDIDMPESPSYYNTSHEIPSADEKTPTIIRKQKFISEEGPPSKKAAVMIIKKPNSSDDDDESEDKSPVIIRKLGNSQPELVVEKSDNEKDDKKFRLRVIKTNELNGSTELEKKLTCKKLETNATEQNRLSRSDLGFKKIKLTTTESVLQKLAKQREQESETSKETADDLSDSPKKNDSGPEETNCDSERNSTDSKLD